MAFKRKIGEYNLEGKLLRTFDSVTRASKEIGFNENYIRQSCKGTRVIDEKYYRYLDSEGNSIEIYNEEIDTDKKLLIYTSGKGIEYIGVFDNEEVAEASLLEHLSENNPNNIYYILGERVMTGEIGSDNEHTNPGFVHIEDYTIGTILELSDSQI